MRSVQLPRAAKTGLFRAIKAGVRGEFPFLGWTFVVRTNDKFISTPSQKSAKKVKAKVKEMMKDSRFNLEERIDKCGSIIRGWRNYHKYCVRFV